MAQSKKVPAKAKPLKASPQPRTIKAKSQPPKVTSKAAKAPATTKAQAAKPLTKSVTKPSKPAAPAVAVHATKSSAAKATPTNKQTVQKTTPMSKSTATAKTTQKAKALKPAATPKTVKAPTQAVKAKPAAKPVAASAAPLAVAKKPQAVAAEPARSVAAAMGKPTQQKVSAPVAPKAAVAAAPKGAPLKAAAAAKVAAAKPAATKVAPPAGVAAPATPKQIAEKAAAAAQQQLLAAQKKPVNQRHGFKKDEFIVYPAHGVGRIVGIEEQEIAGMSLELFVITFDKDKMTLRVPTGKLQSVGMRKLADEGIVGKAMETLKGRARIKRTMWSRRAQEYEAKINSGDLVSIAEVVRDLYRSEQQPEQSYSERQLYEAALDRMAREIAAVEKLDERGAVQRITEVLSKSAKGRRVAAEEAEAIEDGAVKAA